MGDHMYLNEKQQTAVACDDGAIFLLSGAGTGKTRVIVSKVKSILENFDTNSKILILSFTRRSVFDLKTKLQKTSDNLFITTFHGLCYSMISTDFDVKIFDSNFRSSLNLSDQEILQISAKKRLLDFSNITTKPFYEYSSFLAKNGLIDYTDLEILTLKKLKYSSSNDDESLRFDYIFIDEFQDTSWVQFEILKCLFLKHTKIFAVGDPDQSIYSFRGTGERVIETYIKTFKSSTLLLDLNYRCASKILLHANLLIRHNRSKFRKQLSGVKKDEGVVKCFLVKKSDIEKSLVILNIRKCIIEGYQQKDIAIIFRNHKDAVLIKQGLFDQYLSDVQLLSMHQSKGLEFKVVFIIGIKHRLFESKKVLYEERRLLFVAMTRAMDRLYIVGHVRDSKVSRFLKECKFKYETLD